MISIVYGVYRIMAAILDLAYAPVNTYIPYNFYKI